MDSYIDSGDDVSLDLPSVASNETLIDLSNTDNSSESCIPEVHCSNRIRRPSACCQDDSQTT